MPTKEECGKLREEAKAQTAAALASKKASAKAPMFFFTSEVCGEGRKKLNGRHAGGEAHHDSAEQRLGHADSERQGPEEDWWPVESDEVEQGTMQGRGVQSCYK